MKNFNDKYMNWYENHRSIINKISVLNLILFTLILLYFAITDHELFTITIWLWGLSIASLIVNYDK